MHACTCKYQHYDGLVNAYYIAGAAIISRRKGRENINQYQYKLKNVTSGLEIQVESCVIRWYQRYGISMVILLIPSHATMVYLPSHPPSPPS